MSSATTCRAEILEAIGSITARSGRPEFTIVDVIDEMHRRDTKYKESTIRTHIVSRLCANAPDNHQVTYDDLIRVRRGVYRLRGSARNEAEPEPPSTRAS